LSYCGGGAVSDLTDWLAGEMKARGLSQAALARALGLSGRDVVNKILKGKRKLSAAELIQITEKTGIKLPANLVSNYLTDATDARNPVLLKVTGEVAGGLFMDMSASDFDPFEIPYAADPRWPVEAVTALRVRGNSINRVASDGDYVVVLAPEAAPRDFRAGDWVVVHRERAGLVEATVKRVGGNAETGWRLEPYSTDPAHQSPVVLGEHDGEVIRVVGFVIDFIRPATRF
jgi:SOS-response transcriptional repressor LexA